MNRFSRPTAEETYDFLDELPEEEAIEQAWEWGIRNYVHPSKREARS